MKGFHNPCDPWTDIPIWLRLSEPMMLREGATKRDVYKGVRKRARHPVVAWNKDEIRHYLSINAAASEKGCHPSTMVRAIQQGKKLDGMFYMVEEEI